MWVIKDKGEGNPLYSEAMGTESEGGAEVVEGISLTFGLVEGDKWGIKALNGLFDDGVGGLNELLVVIDVLGTMVGDGSGLRDGGEGVLVAMMSSLMDSVLGGEGHKPMGAVGLSEDVEAELLGEEPFCLDEEPMFCCIKQ